jgi:hypothetical protein
MVVRWLMAFEKNFHARGGCGVEFSGLHKILNNQRITRCHVAAHVWATWHRTTNQNCHVSSNDSIELFHVNDNSLTCQISIIPRRLPYQRIVMTRRLYRLYSQHFFLHVWRFEQIMISLSSDVHLNPNKLR